MDPSPWTFIHPSLILDAMRINEPYIHPSAALSSSSSPELTLLCI